MKDLKDRIGLMGAYEMIWLFRSVTETLSFESTASAFGGSGSHGLHVILVLERKYLKKILNERYLY